MNLLDSVYAPPAAAVPWRLEELLAPANVRFYGLGRAALTDAIRSAGLGSGDVVLFPALICKEAVDAARAAGCVPNYYPVSPALGPAAPEAAWPRAKAVVAVDYFGFPQDLAPFQAYANRTGAMLIEDNAHGLFSRAADGTWLGLRGDVGVFSLRKTIAVPNGAALVIPPNSRLALPAPGAFHAGAPARFRIKQALRLVVRGFGRGPVRFLQKFSRGGGSGNGGASEDAFVPAAMLAEPIAVADPEAEVRRRRELYAWCDERARALGASPVFPALPDGVSPYVYAFRASPEADKAVTAQLDREGLDVYTWPELPAEVQADAPAHYRDLRCVRFLW